MVDDATPTIAVPVGEAPGSRSPRAVGSTAKQSQISLGSIKPD